MRRLFMSGCWLPQAVKVAIGWTGTVEELQCFRWFWVWCIICTMELLIIINNSTVFLIAKKFNLTCQHLLNCRFHEAWISTLNMTSCLYYYYHSCCSMNFYWVREDCLQALMDSQCHRRRFAYFLNCVCLDSMLWMYLSVDCVSLSRVEILWLFEMEIVSCLFVPVWTSSTLMSCCYFSLQMEVWWWTLASDSMFMSLLLSSVTNIRGVVVKSESDCVNITYKLGLVFVGLRGCTIFFDNFFFFGWHQMSWC